MSLARCFRYWSSVVQLLVAMIFYSQELRAVWFWWIDFHAIGMPERHMRKPERDQNLNSSIGVPYSSALPNWSPQLASQKSVTWWHSDEEGAVASVYASLSWWRGKWLNDCIVEEEFEWKYIPYWFLPVIDLSAWTAALSCWGCGALLYEARNINAGAISELVKVVSQLIQPTILWYNCMWRRISGSSGSTGGIESIGDPEQ